VRGFAGGGVNVSVHRHITVRVWKLCMAIGLLHADSGGQVRVLAGGVKICVYGTFRCACGPTVCGFWFVA
jgi:hypothetical protein